MTIALRHRSPECVRILWLFPILDSKVFAQSGFELFEFAGYKAGDIKHQ